MSLVIFYDNIKFIFGGTIVSYKVEKKLSGICDNSTKIKKRNVWNNIFKEHFDQTEIHEYSQEGVLQKKNLKYSLLIKKTRLNV